MVRWINQGDIFALDGVNNFAHGCNCSGAMGKGIAIQFRERWPEMYQQYRLLCAKGQFRPGDVFPYAFSTGYVFNLATQASWRSRATLPAIAASVNSMLEFATKHELSTIALPRIGAGLGGLVWEDVKVVIERSASVFPNSDLVVVENYSPHSL